MGHQKGDGARAVLLDAYVFAEAAVIDSSIDVANVRNQTVMIQKDVVFQGSMSGVLAFGVITRWKS